jgi:ribosome-associated toxin RatA of RatAB toxin-antitoxin module
MYLLVADVERYPEFVPWCVEARVLMREGELVTASLSLAQGPSRGTFTTRNRLVHGEFLEMQLVDGPFRLLEGRWDFAAIGDAGSRVSLTMRFEARNALSGIVGGAVLERSCNRLVDSFVMRARSLYGA